MNNSFNKNNNDENKTNCIKPFYSTCLSLYNNKTYVHVHAFEKENITHFLYSINLCLQGGATLVVEFGDDTPLSSLGHYFMVYEGSCQRHVTTARLLSPTKLHSIVPCELCFYVFCLFYHCHFSYKCGIFLAKSGKAFILVGLGS